MKYSIQFYYFILQLKKHLFLSYFILMRLLNDKNASVIWKYLHLVVRLRILYIFLRLKNIFLFQFSIRDGFICHQSVNTDSVAL